MENIERIDLEQVDWKSSKEFFDSLGEALEKLDDRDEAYDFTWVGKRKAIIEAGAPINKTLRPDIEASKDFDNTKNMFIVGDNLDALKLLQESYLGKIKMIYIDPPYNTGHDFVYHDNFTIKKDDYTDSSTGDDGVKLISEDEFTENSKANGRFHSDWLNMIYPRLKLARNLLTDDGVIFISIDDNEQANLKKVCDEVFGEDNFLYQLSVVNNLNGNDNSSGMMETQEYCLIYARHAGIFNMGVLPLNAEDSSDWSIDELGYWKLGGSLKATGVNAPRSARPKLFFPIYINKNTLEWTLDESKAGTDWYHLIPLTDGKEMSWYWSKEKFENDRNEVIVKQVSDGYSLYKKQRPALGDMPSKRGKTTFYSPKYATANSNAELRKIFNNTRIFDYSKATNLIKDFVSLGNTDGESIVLDFFAGSGTTGHAVMDLNTEDGGNRKYILVQLDEKTDEKSEAKKAGYDTIDQITAERLRRAGDKIEKEHPEAKIDTGFRVFRIDSANDREEIRKPASAYNQSELFKDIDNIKPDRTPLDLLFGAISHAALPLDLKLETRKIGDNTIYLYGYLDEGTGLVACFDEQISDETVKEIAKLKSLTAVFHDSSFPDSAAKINLSEHFRILSPDTKIKVL